LMPVKLKPVPLGVIWVMVRSEPPELISVGESVLLLAEATVPKLRPVGFAVSTAGDPAGETPVPARATSKVGLFASLTNLRFPFRLPDDSGAKFTVHVAV